MTKTIVLALSALALASCVHVDTDRAADGTTRLSIPIDMWNNYSGAQIVLNARAQDACPSGYSKIGDEVTDQSKLVWTIRCD